MPDAPEDGPVSAPSPDVAALRERWEYWSSRGVKAIPERMPHGLDCECRVCELSLAVAGLHDMAGDALMALERETVNREAVQRTLAGIVAERDALREARR